MTSTAPLALPVLDPATVHRAVLPNGLTVLVRRDASAPVVAIVTYVKAGYFDETDDVVGVAHVLEHMYFKGTPARGVGEIAKQTKAAGGYLNAGTIYDHTSYYTVLPSSGFLTGLEVQFDAYANSTVDAGELARELEVIIQEAKRKADNPQAVAIETLYELLHDRHRIRRWRIGREAGLRALGREHVHGFYRNFYHPSSTVLSIVGDVDVETAMRHVERLYGALPGGAPARTPGPAEDAAPGFRWREWGGDIAQTQLAVGWRTPGTLDADTPHLDLLATVLSTGRASRLYRAVRERSLVSSVSAFNYTPTELGVFTVYGEAEPEKAGDAVRATWAALRAVREEGVGAFEVERAKRILESQWIRRFEDMEGQANHLAEWESLGDFQLGDRYLERLLETTPEQVADVARRYLDPDQASVLVYRPASSGAIAISGEAMRGFLDAGRAEPLAVTPPVSPRPARSVTQPPRFELEEAGVRVYRTAAGLPILVRRKAGAAIAHLTLNALGGGVDETPATAGLTSLMTRTSVKGTANRTAVQIAEEGELLGGSVGGAAGGDAFGWSISVPGRHVAAAVELLADVVCEPTFAAEELETERAAAIAGVRALRDDMYRYPTRLATQAAFGEHPYGVPVSGTEESLAAISADALREWHRRHVLEGELVAAVVADGDPDELARLVARAFESLRPAATRSVPRPVWPERASVRAESREKAQTALTLLFPSPARDDDDRFVASMIAGIASGLGGRFFDELREKRSLCYTVMAFQSDRRLAGTFVTYVATGPQQEEEARAQLLAEFAKFRESPVSAEELERAQTYAIGTHAIRQQSGGAVLGDVVDAWLFGRLSELERYEESVRAVTPERIQAVARRYFDPDVRVEGIVRGVAKTV